jgi:hypothetical protein
MTRLKGRKCPKTRAARVAARQLRECPPIRLSPSVEEVLTNFCRINPSWWQPCGNTTLVLAPDREVYGRARNLDVTFYRDFAVYELSRFLKTWKLLGAGGKPRHFRLLEDRLVIASDKNHATFLYCEPDEISHTDKEVKLPSVDSTTKLTAKTLRAIKKQQRLLSTAFISFVGDGSNLILETHNRCESDSTSEILGPTSYRFRAVFESRNFLCLADHYDYVAQISKAGYARFEGVRVEGKGAELEYFVVMDAESSSFGEESEPTKKEEPQPHLSAQEVKALEAWANEDAADQDAAIRALEMDADLLSFGD